MESSQTEENSGVKNPSEGLPEEVKGSNGRPKTLASALVGSEGFFTTYPDALFVLNEGWQIMYANPAVERIFGKRENLLGRTLWEQWPEAVREQVEQGHKRALKEQIPIQLEEPSSKNAHNWLELRVSQCEFGVVAYYRDISTERRSSELQERLASVVQSSNDAIVSKDLNGIITSWNRGAQELFGYNADEIVGKPITTLAAPDVIDEIPNILERIRRGERVDHYETKRKTKDGKILTVSLTISPIRNASGTIIGASKVARDISESRGFTELQERLAAIVQSSDDAIVSKDLNGIITSWNRGAEKLFGYSADEIIGKPITTLAPPDVIDEIPNILERIRRGERVDHYETKRRTKDGRILTVSLTVSPIRDGSGKIIGASKVARDITEKKLQEKALRDANAALIQSNEDLSQFAHVASHDLRSPLNTVVQFAQLLERRHGEELGEGKELLGHLIAASTRMGALIEDLLLYAKVSGAPAARREPVDANAQLKIAIENVEEAVRKSGAEITCETLPTVPIEKTRLIQIFQNLIGNAIRYRSDSQPRIHIGVRDQNDVWCFSCADNGIGIAPEYQQQIFEPFKRLHGSELPGSGIGLAVCKKIVERHGGRIWVESEPNHGATFFFTILKS